MKDVTMAKKFRENQGKIMQRHATTSFVSEREVSSADSTDLTLTTVFDFDTTTMDTSFDNETATKKIAVESFERIDDAIMGGISTSSLRDVPGETYASWSGVCRTDGGGFCGTRTLPFREPLDVCGSDGLLVDCRLASDNEPERRVWKVTMRTDTSRGEMVYQAAFPLPKRQDEVEDKKWTRVKVPFSDFKLVRGPRVVVGAPALNATGGIYQIGFSLSKFVIGVNTTELEGFRPGYFDLQLRQVGFYADKAATSLGVSMPDTLSKQEVEKKRPILLKVLLPLVKLFFSEKVQRRKSAMRILTQKRGLSRAGAIRYGIRCRAKAHGLLASLFKTASIFATDSFRTVFFTIIRLCLLYPIRVISGTIRFVKKKVLGMDVKELPKIE